MHHSMTKSKTVGAALGSYLKYQRQKQQLSLQTLADRIRCTPSFLLRLEQGAYQTVKLDVVEKIAQAFNMSVIELLGKCQVGGVYEARLPSLDHYLKEVFHFPSQAIQDVHQFVDFIALKYQAEIKAEQGWHDRYWAQALAGVNRIKRGRPKTSEKVSPVSEVVSDKS